MIGKQSRTSLDSAVFDVRKRELGELSTRKFALRRAASEDLVLRLDILRKLDKHRGCVNTVSFNADGDILISGSDDRRVILWDWETGCVKLSFHSGHRNNVFQAKIMPYSEDRSLVTCAADGQVRHAQILEHGKVETKLLAEHHGRAHKLAIEPGSPHILYSCGEDGVVQHIDLRTGTATEILTCEPTPRSRFRRFIQLNAITIDPRNPNLFAVGGSDEYARLFDIRKYKWDGSASFGQPVDFFCPPHLVGDQDVGITGLQFSNQSELLLSYNNDFIYLFTRDVGLGPDPISSSSNSDGSDASDMNPDDGSVVSPQGADANIKPIPQVYKGHVNVETVKGVSFFGPKCEYVVSGSDCGRIFIWKKKSGELIRVIKEADKHVVNCIEPHPHTTMLASSGIESDIKIWVPKAINRATLPTNIQKDKVNLVRRGIGFSTIFFDDDHYQLYGDEEEEEEEEDDDDDDESSGDGDSDSDDYLTDSDDEEENYSEEKDCNGNTVFISGTDEHDNEIDDDHDDSSQDFNDCEDDDDGDDNDDNRPEEYNCGGDEHDLSDSFDEIGDADDYTDFCYDDENDDEYIDSDD